MSRAKVQPTNIFQIIINGFMIYIKNFIPLSKVMIFPVFGQLLGIILIIYPSYMLSKSAIKLFSADVLVNKIMFFYLLLIVTVIPGFFIFAKAFWEYMVVTVSLNSMIATINKTGILKDMEIKIQNQAVKLRAKEYIGLLFILMFIWLVGLMIPSVIFLTGNNAFTWLSFTISEIGVIFVLLIVSIYLSLSFQTFAFENISVINVLKRSWSLIEGNFWRALFLGIAMFIITGVVVPPIFQMLAEKTTLLNHAMYPIKLYLVALFGDMTVLSQINSYFPGLTICPTPDSPMFCINNMAKIIILSTIGVITTAIMLPLGSACYTLLYLDIAGRKTAKK